MILMMIYEHLNFFGFFSQIVLGDHGLLVPVFFSN